MKINFSNLTINQKLALFALILGLIALFMKDPLKARIVSVDANELALKVQDKSSSINVVELADWLIQKKADFKLIDLRDEKKFKEYFIPGAINLQSTELNNLKLAKNQKILLYSDDNLQTAQAWFILKSKNFKAVYMLSGGINEWKDKVLFPTITENATPDEKAKFAKMSEICKYFGGTPRILAQGDQMAVSTQPTVMPKIAPPQASAKSTGGKAKREGC